MGGSLPLLIDLAREGGIYADVPIAVTILSAFDVHLLMPAVHAAGGIGLNGEGHVLVDSGLLPEHTLAVGVT